MFRSIVIALSLLNSIIAPFNNSYTIEIPNVINVEEDGSFSIRMKKNDLSDSQRLILTFPSNFLLQDEYGKEDIEGVIKDSNITIEKGDLSKTIQYSINKIPVGKWKGKLSMTIDLNNLVKSNTLDKPEYVNEILNQISPNIIRFSHDEYNYEEVYDISLAKDNSILLYNVDDSEVIITNKTNAKIEAEDINGLFSNLTRLTTIYHLDYLDTSICNDFSHLFYNNRYLTEIQGIESLDTSNIDNMAHIFDGCSNITTIDISNWDVSKVKNLEYAFNKNNKLVDYSFLENWNTASLENINYTFSSSRANSINLRQWDTSNIKTMDGTFKSSRFKTIDISRWNLENCTSMKSLFEGCNYLTNIIGLNSLNTINVQDMSYLFASTIFTNLDLTNFKTDSVKNLSYFLYNNKKITSINGLENLNVSNVENMSSMFRNCVLLKTIDVSNWNTENVRDFSFFISSSSISSPNNIIAINGFEDLNFSNALDTSSMLSGCRYLVINDLSRIKLLNIKNISNMFSGCWNVNINSAQNWNQYWSEAPIMTNAFSDNAGMIVNASVPSWYRN